MMRLVIICPDCGDSINMEVSKASITHGGFTSRCHTKIDFTVDNRFSTEDERVRALKEKAKDARSSE